MTQFELCFESLTMLKMTADEDNGCDNLLWSGFGATVTLSRIYECFLVG